MKKFCESITEFGQQESGKAYPEQCRNCRQHTELEYMFCKTVDEYANYQKTRTFNNPGQRYYGGI